MSRQETARAVKQASSLADALFSKTQQRVLGALFGQPQRSFYASELIGMSRGGSGAVQRELARLEASGLVRSQRIGNRKHYQAEPACPVFSELVGIFGRLAGGGMRTPTPSTGLKVAEMPAEYDASAMVLQRLKVSRRALAALCRRHGIRKLAFFGSVTRSDFGPDSDVDVMVEFDGGQVPGLFGINDLHDDLSKLFGGRRVDVLTNPAIRNRFRRRAIERDLLVAYAA